MNAMTPVNEWFKKGADLEAQHDITIGTRLPSVRPVAADRPSFSLGVLALGKLIEFRRRALGLSMHELATQANVPVAQVLCLERGLVEGLSPAIFSAVAKPLGLPEDKLAELAGSDKQTPSTLQEAAVRFAARVTETEKLRPEEHSALSDFVRVLVGA